MTKKFQKNFKKNESAAASLEIGIKDACEGLIYVSETDAPVTIFTTPAGLKSRDEILQYAGANADTPVREVPFAAWFGQVTAMKEWFGEAEKSRAKKFLELQKLLEEGLTSLRVYRVGTIRIDIYIVGESADGRIIGVKTLAVET